VRGRRRAQPVATCLAAWQIGWLLHPAGPQLIAARSALSRAWWTIWRRCNVVVVRRPDGDLVAQQHVTQGLAGGQLGWEAGLSGQNPSHGLCPLHWQVGGRCGGGTDWAETVGGKVGGETCIHGCCQAGLTVFTDRVAREASVEKRSGRGIRKDDQLCRRRHAPDRRVAGRSDQGTTISFSSTPDGVWSPRKWMDCASGERPSRGWQAG
jgi:hypothetical protein